MHNQPLAFPGCLATLRNGQYRPSEPGSLTTPASEKKDTSSLLKERDVYYQYTSSFMLGGGESAKFSTRKNVVVSSGSSLIVCVCFGKRTAFPCTRSPTEQQKKPDSGPSRRSIVEERIPCWLCKLKPSKAEQAETAPSLFLQHGLLHYETWQSQRRGRQTRWYGSLLPETLDFVQRLIMSKY